jgi:hypothetical protein
MYQCIVCCGRCAAHLTGAYTNAACLNRLGKKFGNIVIAQDLPEAKALLLNGTVRSPSSSLSQSSSSSSSNAGPIIKKLIILAPGDHK